MARLEKTYQGEIKRSFDKYLNDRGIVGIYTKIPDTGYSRNPYDSLCMYPDRNYVAMEQKINKSVKTFNFKTFFRGREHELACLERVRLCGFKSWVTINHYVPKYKINTAYALTITQALSFYEIGSVTLSQIKDAAIELKRIKGSIWDLSVIFN